MAFIKLNDYNDQKAELPGSLNEPILWGPGPESVSRGPQGGGGPVSFVTLATYRNMLDIVPYPRLCAAQ